MRAPLSPSAYSLHDSGREEGTGGHSPLTSWTLSTDGWKRSVRMVRIICSPSVAEAAAVLSRSDVLLNVRLKGTRAVVRNSDPIDAILAAKKAVEEMGARGREDGGAGAKLGRNTDKSCAAEHIGIPPNRGRGDRDLEGV